MKKKRVARQCKEVRGGGDGGVQADGLKCRYVVHVKPTLNSALLPELGLKTAEIQASLQSALFFRLRFT